MSRQHNRFARKKLEPTLLLRQQRSLHVSSRNKQAIGLHPSHVRRVLGGVTVMAGRVAVTAVMRRMFTHETTVPSCVAAQTTPSRSSHMHIVVVVVVIVIIVVVVIVIVVIRHIQHTMAGCVGDVGLHSRLGGIGHSPDPGHRGAEGRINSSGLVHNNPAVLWLPVTSRTPPR